MKFKALIKLFKLKIKQAFCSHEGYEAEITENPQPIVWLDIKVRCLKCGITNYELLDRATTSHKILIANDVLFQRNCEKFPEYYERVRNQMMNKEED